MSGTSKTTFEPMTNLTRGQFITVLYNLEGKPNTTFKNIFSDVKESDFFGPAVVWASTKNIVKGIGNGKFGPNQQITREELATMLYNYASYKKYSLQIDSYVLDKFADAGKVQSWAHKPVEWAVTQGVINGKGKNASGMDVLDPQGKATRAECAQMIKNLVEKVINKKK